MPPLSSLINYFKEILGMEDLKTLAGMDTWNVKKCCLCK